MLPKDKPVTFTDMNQLRQKLGYTVEDFQAEIGIPMRKWSELKGTPDEPLHDPSLSLIIRALDFDADLGFVPHFPKAEEVYAQAETLAGLQNNNLPHETFTISMGRDSTSSYRWKQGAVRTTPTVDRALRILQRLLAAKGFEGWLLWEEFCDTEAQARGIKDIWLHGNWRSGKYRAARASVKPRDGAKATTGSTAKPVETSGE